MLSSNQIRSLLEKRTYQRHFPVRVVCGRNELSRCIGRRPAVYIINTLASFDPRVGHWICCVFKDSMQGNEVTYFDPLGSHYSSYHPDISMFIENNSFYVNVCARFPIQSCESVSCGWYCCIS